MLYVQLKKALYGTLQAAQLFWKLLSDKLQEWGFTLNPCNKCIANKDIEGKQCTIIWHIDDLKILRVSNDIVEDIFNKTRHFLAAQGQHLPTTTIYQENKSTILL